MSNITDKIIEVGDIVEVISRDVDLTMKGQNYVGICPFHDDNEPSFTVSPNKKIYKCFSCGEGGNIITFTQKFHHLTFEDSLLKLSEMYGIEYRKPQAIKIPQEIELLNYASKYYNTILTTTKIASDARTYLYNRKINDELIEYFELGYSSSKELPFMKHFNEKLTDTYSYSVLEQSGLTTNDKDFFFNRIMIPIKDQNNNTVGFSGRVLTDENPKYLNSKNSAIFNKSNILYNLNNAKRYLNERQVFIVEGYFDVFSLYKINVHNVVATMGTSFTKEHVELLKRNRVNRCILTMDQDRAGFDAMYNVGKMLLKNGITEIDVIKYNGFKDIDEYLNANTDILPLLDTKLNFFQFKITYLQQVYNITDLALKSKYINEVCEDLNKIDANLQYLILNELSNVVNISVENLQANIKTKAANNVTVESKRPVKEIKNSYLLPTNDDVIIKYCLESKQNCYKIKKMVDDGEYTFRRHEQLFEYLYEFYKANDTFDIISYDEHFANVADNYYDTVIKIQKNEALDLTKVDMIFNLQNKTAGRKLISITTNRR